MKYKSLASAIPAHVLVFDAASPAWIIQYNNWYQHAALSFWRPSSEGLTNEISHVISPPNSLVLYEICKI